MSQPYAPPVQSPDQRKHRKWPWLVGAVALIVVGAAVVNGGSKSDTDTATVTSTGTSSSVARAPAPKSNVKITKFKTDSTTGITDIEGTYKNDGDDKSYVQIEGVILDSDGNQVDTFLANTTNLSANQTWKWKSSSMVANAKDAVKAQIKAVSSY